MFELTGPRVEFDEAPRVEAATAERLVMLAVSRVHYAIPSTLRFQLVEFAFNVIQVIRQFNVLVIRLPFDESFHDGGIVDEPRA